MKFARGCAAISQLDMIKKWCVRKRQAARDRSRRMFQRKLRTESAAAEFIGDVFSRRYSS